MTGLRVALTPGDFTGQPNILARPAGDGDVCLGRVAEVGDADVALFPYDLAACLVFESDRSALMGIIADNARVGLRTILVLTHDQTAPLELGQPDSIVLRTSMLRSQHYRAEYPAPIFLEDPYGGGTFEPRPWTPTPVVGFMGYSGMGDIHRAIRAAETGTAIDVAGAAVRAEESVRDAVLRSPVNIGLHLRRRAIDALRLSRDVRADIVERDRYFGACSLDVHLAWRQEYARHLFGSDYILCVRGAGNYSFRLFETLAAGRVPVIIDSDLVLPCADVVDWRALGVWIPLEDIDRIGEVVAREHAEGGPDGFERRQRAARAAYVEALSATAFAGYVADHLGGPWARGGDGDG